jgi:hypothetical protein
MNQIKLSAINSILFIMVYAIICVCYWCIKSVLKMARQIYEIFLMIHYDGWNTYLLEQEMEEIVNNLHEVNNNI